MKTPTARASRCAEIVSDALELDFSANFSNDTAGPAADKLVAVVGPVGPYAAWSNNTILPKYGVQYSTRDL